MLSVQFVLYNINYYDNLFFIIYFTHFNLYDNEKRYEIYFYQHTNKL